MIGILALRGTNLVTAIFCLIYGIFMLLSSASYIYTTRVGKFQSWADILSQLGLQGDEQALVMGCGRGAVLLMVASLLPRGKAVGVDVMRSFLIRIISFRRTSAIWRTPLAFSSNTASATKEYSPCICSNPGTDLKRYVI